MMVLVNLIQINSTALEKEYVELAKQRTKLKETKVYYEAARSMLTGYWNQD